MSIQLIKFVEEPLRPLNHFPGNILKLNPLTIIAERVYKGHQTFQCSFFEKRESKGGLLNDDENFLSLDACLGQTLRYCREGIWRPWLITSAI